MVELPTGTLTFLFTDIEKSTRLLGELSSRFQSVLERLQELVSETIESHGGLQVSNEGDSFFCVFVTAPDGLAAAIDLQRKLATEDWPSGHDVKVRIGLHTGVAALGGDNYVGLDVNRGARIGGAAHGGQVLVSATTRLLGEAGLSDGVTFLDLGEFQLKGLDQPEHLFQLVIDGLQSKFPPLRDLDAAPTNLPVASSNFIGRERERQEIEKLLDEARLVTITGVAGAGKSRLALEVAYGSRGAHHDGVWFVELAPIRDDELVAQAITRTIGLQESPGSRSIDLLVNFLSDGSRLLVLDNCEHLLDGVGEVASLLMATAPDLRVLATSRQVLGLAGEVRYPCPPLAVPKVGESTVGILDYDGVALFDARAREVDPTFVVAEENADVIASICRKLDGLPLAIELAAALVRILTPEEIEGRLDHRFELLTGGPRTAPTHQQTLRAALDSTFELLNDYQQEFAVRLGVFVGSFDVGTAEAVASGGTIDPADVIDCLSALVDRSLITTIPTGGDLRLTILESVRQYLLEELEKRGELEERQLAHAQHFQRLVDEASMGLRGSEQGSWAARLDADIENVRAAVAFVAAAGDVAGLRLVDRMYLYWLTRGEWSDALHWTRLALETTSTEDSALRARVTAIAGFFATDLGDSARGIADLEAGLAMAKRTGDIHAIGFCSSFLGTELSRRDMDLERGIALLSEAQRIYAQLGEPYGEAWVNRYLALSHQERGNLEESIRLQTLSLEAFRDVGDVWNIRFSQALLAEAMHTIGNLERSRELYNESLRGSSDPRFKLVIAHALKGLGKVSLAEGKLDEAADHLGEALTELREIGDVARAAETTGHLAMVNLGRGHPVQAAELLRESLAVFQELGDKGGVAWSLERVAMVQAACGNRVRAAQLLGAAIAIRERSGSVRPVVDQPDVDRLEAELQADLGKERFAAERGAGGRIDLDEAVALGRAD